MELFSSFYFLVNLGAFFSPWQSLPAIAGLWLVHFIVMVICLTDEDSQCWKIKTVQSSKQWYDSDLHSYLSFHPSVWIRVMVSPADIICGWWFWLGDGFLVLIILTRSRFCALFCNIVTLEFRVWNYSAVFIFWWIWGHFSPWQSLPAIAWTLAMSINFLKL